MPVDEKWFDSPLGEQVAETLLMTAVNKGWEDEVIPLLNHWLAHQGKNRSTQFAPILHQVLSLIPDGLEKMSFRAEWLLDDSFRKGVFAAVIGSNAVASANFVVSSLRIVFGESWEDEVFGSGLDEGVCSGLRQSAVAMRELDAFRILDAGVAQNFGDELLDFLFSDIVGFGDTPTLRELMGNLPAWCLVESSRYCNADARDGSFASGKMSLLEFSLVSGFDLSVRKIVDMCKDEEVEWRNFVSLERMREFGASSVSSLERLLLPDSQGKIRIGKNVC